MVWESPAGLQARWWLGSPSWRTSTRLQGRVPGRKVGDKSVQWSHPAKVKQQKCIDLQWYFWRDLMIWKHTHIPKSVMRGVLELYLQTYIVKYLNGETWNETNFKISPESKYAWNLLGSFHSCALEPFGFPRFPQKKAAPKFWANFSPRRLPGTRLLGLSLHLLPRSARCHGTDGSTA